MGLAHVISVRLLGEQSKRTSVKLDLLILSDRKQLEATYGAAITKSGMAPVWASDVDAVLHELQHRSFDAIAIDFDSTSIDCIKACSEIVSASLLPVFALASQESEEVMLPLLGTQISGTFQIPPIRSYSPNESA